jgi:hypothetical protein
VVVVMDDNFFRFAALLLLVAILVGVATLLHEQKRQNCITLAIAAEVSPAQCYGPGEKAKP